MEFSDPPSQTSGKRINDIVTIGGDMRYEVLEHTADVMIRTTGDSLEDCFANAAYALFDQMVDADSIVPKVVHEFEVDGFDLESLLLNFLSEFLFIHDTTRLVFNEFDVAIEGLKVQCQARGERIDLQRHGPKKEIKAITYHMMSIDLDIPSVTVIFDI
jgi:SHS2 domain-containing protein